MSSNVFMLPALPQPPAPALNGPDARGPAVCKSDQLSPSTAENSSFSATLKQISDRRYGSSSKAAVADKSAATDRRADVQSSDSQEMTKRTENAPEPSEGDAAPLSVLSEKTAPFHHPRLAFDRMLYHLMNLSIIDNGSLAVQPLSDPAAVMNLPMFGDWIGQMHSQGEAVHGEPVGIGPFEQLQANISPETTNWLLFEQLVLRAVALQGDGNRPAALVETGTLNNQTESSGVNGNPLLNSLPPLPEMAQLNPDLLKTAAPSQTTETGLSDGVKLVAVDPNGSLSFWKSADGNSENPLEAQARQLNANLQPLKIQADLHVAVEQPASANSIVEGITAKAPEEVFSIKSAASKDAITAADVFGNKSAQIDGDSKDSGLLFSQDQMPQHLARLENTSHSAETAQRGLMAQTLDQIVQKAVLSFNNGQHEVQIDLKPDFLGHIRMHIVSEGHQVAIKIVAELPFVKDMLENNLHQLKTVLQAQGLNIDELEVSLAQDFHGESDTRQTAEPAKVQTFRSGTDLNDQSSEKQSQLQSQGGGTAVESAIDYFA